MFIHSSLACLAFLPCLLLHTLDAFAEAPPLSLHSFSLLTPWKELLLYEGKEFKRFSFFSCKYKENLIPSVWTENPLLGLMCLFWVWPFFWLFSVELILRLICSSNKFTEERFARNRAGQTCPCNQVWNTTAKQAFKINQVFISTKSQLNFLPLARSCQNALKRKITGHSHWR